MYLQIFCASLLVVNAIVHRESNPMNDFPSTHIRAIRIPLSSKGLSDPMGILPNELQEITRTMDHLVENMEEAVDPLGNFGPNMAKDLLDNILPDFIKEGKNMPTSVRVVVREGFIDPKEKLFGTSQSPTHQKEKLSDNVNPPTHPRAKPFDMVKSPILPKNKPLSSIRSPVEHKVPQYQNAWQVDAHRFVARDLSKSCDTIREEYKFLSLYKTLFPEKWTRDHARILETSHQSFHDCGISVDQFVTYVCFIMLMVLFIVFFTLSLILIVRRRRYDEHTRQLYVSLNDMMPSTKK